MTPKPKTPYQRLVENARGWALEVLHPRTVDMWNYPKAKLSELWSLTDLWERTATADQLGYDVVLRAKDDGLRVVYRKRPETPPWEIAP